MPELARVEPPYLQIAADLRSQIMDGRLAPGDTVPSTRALMEQWGVSKATATRALAVLADEGLTIGQAGRGTSVRSAAATYRRARDRYALLRQTGKFHQANERSTIAESRLVIAPAEVRQALNLPENSEAIKRHRITTRDDQIIEISTSWFPPDLAEIAPLLLSTERIPSGTATYVSQQTGRQLAHGQETTYARLATSAECEELGRKRPLAVLVTEHVACDRQGEPVTYEVGLAPPGHRVTYNYDI